MRTKWTKTTKYSVAVLRLGAGGRAAYSTTMTIMAILYHSIIHLSIIALEKCIIL
jgi:hypothetical protein